VESSPARPPLRLEDALPGERLGSDPASMKLMSSVLSTPADFPPLGAARTNRDVRVGAQRSLTPCSRRSHRAGAGWCSRRIHAARPVGGASAKVVLVTISASGVPPVEVDDAASTAVWIPPLGGAHVDQLARPPPGVTRWMRTSPAASNGTAALRILGYLVDAPWAGRVQK